MEPLTTFGTAIVERIINNFTTCQKSVFLIKNTVYE